MEQDEDSHKMQLTLNQDFLVQKIKAIPPETSQEIAEIQVVTKQLQQENTTLKEKVEGIIAS